MIIPEYLRGILPDEGVPSEFSDVFLFELETELANWKQDNKLFVAEDSVFLQNKSLMRISSTPNGPTGSLYTITVNSASFSSAVAAMDSFFNELLIQDTIPPISSIPTLSALEKSFSPL